MTHIWICLSTCHITLLRFPNSNIKWVNSRKRTIISVPHSNWKIIFLKSNDPDKMKLTQIWKFNLPSPQHLIIPPTYHQHIWLPPCMRCICHIAIPHLIIILLLPLSPWRSSSPWHWLSPCQHWYQCHSHSSSSQSFMPSGALLLTSATAWSPSASLKAGGKRCMSDPLGIMCILLPLGIPPLWGWCTFRFRSTCSAHLLAQSLFQVWVVLHWLIVLFCLLLQWCWWCWWVSCLFWLCISSGWSAMTAVAVAKADGAMSPVLNIRNISSASPLSTGWRMDKSWNLSSTWSCGIMDTCFWVCCLGVIRLVLILLVPLIPTVAGVVVAELGPVAGHGLKRMMNFISDAIVGFNAYMANDKEFIGWCHSPGFMFLAVFLSTFVFALFSNSPPPHLLGIRINADSLVLVGLGIVSQSSFSCHSFCLFLTFNSLHLFKLFPTSSFTTSLPFPTKHTSLIPLSSPTSVLASTLECMLNTLMLVFAKLTMNHDLSRKKEVTVEYWALSRLASEGGMRGGE